MNSARENPHLRGRPAGLRNDDPADIDSEIGKVSEELLPLSIIAYQAHGERLCAKRPKIVDRVGASTGNDLSFTVIQNENRRLAGDSRNFAVDKYVGDEIADHDKTLSFESINDVWKPVHANAPETIDSTAVSKLSATKCGC